MLFSGALADAQETPSPLAALEGSWAVVSITEDGEPVPREKFGGFKFRFKKKELTWLSPDGKVIDQFTISVDATQKPTALNLVQTRKEDEEGNPKTTLAIYKLKSDLLRICMPPRGEKQRPKSFESQSGSFLSLIVLKRIAPNTADKGRTKP